MRTAFKKVWRDLWLNHGRTVLVVLSISVGVLALGLTQTSNRLLNDFIDASRQASQPAHVRMALDVPFSDPIVEIIQNLPGVDQVEGFSRLNIRWKPEPGSDWQDSTVTALKDYENQRFDLVEFISGTWPTEDSVAVEFNHLPHYGLPEIGGTIYFEGANRTVPMTLSGTVRDPGQSPPPFNLFGQPAFYLDMAGWEAITGSNAYTNLRFSVPSYDEETAREAAEVVEDRLVRLGVRSAVSAFSIDITDPDRAQAQEFLDGLGIILVTMAFMSLGLSIFLVVNTINAIITNQVRQIGIMKTVGAIRRQVFLIYLSGVLVYGALSILIAVPVGALGGFYLSRWLLFALNVQVDTFRLLPEVILSQVGVGLLTPLAAAAFPILRGTAIPTREAIGSYGIGRGVYGTRRLDRTLASLQGLPRLASLTLRNTFRRMGRVLLTELTLVGAGAIFMMVVTTGASFNQTIDDIWESWGFEVIMVFQGFQRADEVTQTVEAHPDVENVELWIWMDASAHLPEHDQVGDKQTVSLRGVPDNSTQFDPRLTSGRSLTLEDGHAVIINQWLAQEMGLEIGDWLVVELPGGRESNWQVVGTAFDIAPGGVQNTVFMRQSLLSADLHRPGQGTVAQIETVRDTRAVQDGVAEYFANFYEEEGVGITFTMGQLENRELATALWGLIGGLLQIMSVLMAMVGSIGLSGTLSINVIERRREIGVMRAVGASSLDVGRIFIGEGLLLGVVSWALAVPLSMLAARQFVNTLGRALEFPFFYRYSLMGMWLWLGIVILLSLLASWLPAQRAAGISVRESLAYE